MQAIILAAGMGRRLSKESHGLPKAMLRIGDKSIIQNQIEQCLSIGVDRFVFVIGYEKDHLRAHIVRFLPDKEIIFIENDRYEVTNTLYSLYLACEYFSDGFIYFNGDVFFGDKLLSLIDLDNEQSQLLLRKDECADEEVKMIISEENRILEIGKHLPLEQCAGEFIGIGYFADADLELFTECLKQGIKDGEENNYFEFAVNILCRQKELLAISTGEARCLEIDFPEDIKKARALFK